MSDLTVKDSVWCRSNEHWERKVAGSNGKVYTVVYGKTDRGTYSHGYTCDCKAFQYGIDRVCKHIKAVQGERCAWNVEAAMGSGEPYPANGKCPKCGGELVGLRVMV
jgi:hypothetical protein